jgi:hypothetical protein
VTLKQVCRALNARRAALLQRRHGVPELPHVGDVIEPTGVEVAAAAESGIGRPLAVPNFSVLAHEQSQSFRAFQLLQDDPQANDHGKRQDEAKDAPKPAPIG